MEGGRTKKEVEREEEEEGEHGHRWRRGEERGDCDFTAGMDDGCAEIERHRHNEEGTDVGIEDGHAPSRIANVRGDFNTERGNKDAYAVVLATAKQKIPLTEITVDSVDMKKAMTGAITIRVPGDKDRGKASLLATRLAEVLDPTTVRVTAATRTAELRVVRIDISVNKEELRQALASAAGCGSAEVQVGEIRASRDGLGSMWIKCPVAGARKLAREGIVALGWSRARVIAIPKRPLQCYRCLGLGHVRVTCVPTVNLCYRCGGGGHRVGGCFASAPKCPLCEGARRPQNGQGGMRSLEGQEEATHSRVSRGNTAKEHRQSSGR
jgi:hypothetical protein